MADGLLGRAIWHELLATDVLGARSLYTDIVGWTVAPFGGGQPGYDI